MCVTTNQLRADSPLAGSLAASLSEDQLLRRLIHQLTFLATALAALQVQAPRRTRRPRRDRGSRLASQRISLRADSRLARQLVANSPVALAGSHLAVGLLAPPGPALPLRAAFHSVSRQTSLQEVFRLASQPVIAVLQELRQHLQHPQHPLREASRSANLRTSHHLVVSRLESLLAMLITMHPLRQLLVAFPLVMWQGKTALQARRLHQRQVAFRLANLQRPRLTLKLRLRRADFHLESLRKSLQINQLQAAFHLGSLLKLPTHRLRQLRAAFLLESLQKSRRTSPLRADFRLESQRGPLVPQPGPHPEASLLANQPTSPRRSLPRNPRVASLSENRLKSRRRNPRRQPKRRTNRQPMPRDLPASHLESPLTSPLTSRRPLHQLVDSHLQSPRISLPLQLLQQHRQQRPLCCAARASKKSWQCGRKSLMRASKTLGGRQERLPHGTVYCSRVVTK